MKSLLTTIIKKIKAVEECNDENKSIQDDLNQDNVEERNPRYRKQSKYIISSCRYI